jgi:FMN phosphatase YigB (HAD superfamily)
MKTCLAKYGQKQQAKADYEIESFRNLLEIIDRCNEE